MSTILLPKIMSPHGSADDSNGEPTEMLDIDFHGIANLNQTEYIQKTANKYFLLLFCASFTCQEMFREQFSAEISSRRDIYAGMKARYPAGLN